MEFDGREPVVFDGFTYLPRFFSAEEGAALIRALRARRPIWERRHHVGAKAARKAGGQLSRPVYWYGAWQFASLGYYAPPSFTSGRAIVSEPFPLELRAAADKSTDVTRDRHDGALEFTSALVNFYGKDTSRHPHVDMARLRAHKDVEPGPVVMFSLGQPARLEFVRSPDEREPVLSLWVRHRSLVVISGPRFKDALFHRVSQVRFGNDPVIESPLENFAVRRISVSLRHVPPEHIARFCELPSSARDDVREYVASLAAESETFASQLREEGLDVKTGDGVVR